MRRFNTGVLIMAMALSVACVGCAGPKQAVSMQQEMDQTREVAKVATPGEHEKEPGMWTIVPGEQVGQITPETSEKALKKIYGKENVVEATISIGEGKTQKGTVIFPNDPRKTAKILWTDELSKLTPMSVTVVKPKQPEAPKKAEAAKDKKKDAKAQKAKTADKKSDDKKDTAKAPEKPKPIVPLWQMEQGIGFKTSLKDLEEINGRAFKLTSPKAKDPARVTSWNEGFLDHDFTVAASGNVIIKLDAEKLKSAKGLKDFGENDAITSEHPSLQHINPTVTEMTIIFHEGPQ